ncbi:MAG: HAMP domain-containing sensor histidine kinase [Vicinamibacterales bacterium]
MSEPAASRRWFRSLYWRIAVGFIAVLALMLAVQGGLLLWLSSSRDEALPPRLVGDLAMLVADELAAEIDRAPGADPAVLAEARFRDLGRPAALVLADGRVVAGDVPPPEPLVRLLGERLRAGDTDFPPRPPGGRGRRDARPFPPSEGPAGPGFGRFGGPPWAMAPVHVAGGRVAGVVLVARGRPLGTVAREIVPWLVAGAIALLLAGTVVASMAVFRPAQARLRDLEDAARRFAGGDRSARAAAVGGDEVAEVARAFNRMADEAAQREAALMEADRARRQLLADVTHELRTPLTAIRGYAETLTLDQYAPAHPDGRRFVHIVDVEAQRLERLVNDLLDLARLDAGGGALDRAPVAIAALFTRVRERHERAAEAAGVALDTTVGTGVDTVPGDARRLEQVVQNLTANALRHTPRGGHVSLDAAREGDAVVLRVRDTGEGIAAEHLPHVFDRFYKADAARADAGGTGLGLSIGKAIVERHGGAVAVTSTPGVETVFSVRLPA